MNKMLRVVHNYMNNLFPDVSLKLKLATVPITSEDKAPEQLVKSTGISTKPSQLAQSQDEAEPIWSELIPLSGAGINHYPLQHLQVYRKVIQKALFSHGVQMAGTPKA
jgi:hypothetical protein